jgi:steroid delta-isomerase-like uncharacterized protein
MKRTEIEALVQRWATQAVALGSEEAWDELLTEDVRDLSGAAPTQGRDSFKARAAAVRNAFSKLTVSVDDLVVEGDAISWRWTLSGVHVGTFLSVAPTGKPIQLRGVNFQRLRDRRVAEHWTIADLAGLSRQLHEGAAESG